MREMAIECLRDDVSGGCMEAEKKNDRNLEPVLSSLCLGNRLIS
jgi:hypothetical protein